MPIREEIKNNLETMYHYDLHCHTNQSQDSPAELRKTVRIAKRRGIDGIAVTDHNKIYNGPLRIEGIDIIPGSEITLKDGGHLLAYFVTEKIEPRRSLRETVAAVKAQGGYAILAHPLRDDHGWIKNGAGKDMTIDEALKIIDGLESGNSSVSKDEMDRVSEIARQAGIIETAGSDLHISGLVGFSAVAVKERISKENFIEVMREAEIIIRPEVDIFWKDVRHNKKILMRIARRLGLYNIEFIKYLFFSLVIKNYFRFKNRKFERFEFNLKDDSSVSIFKKK